MSARFRCRRGFTLLEVLAALMIFSVAAVVLASSYLNVLLSYEAVSRGAQVGEDFAFARQMLITQSDRKKVEEGGDFQTANGRRVTWRAEVQATEVPDVYQVAFTCEIEETGKPEPDKLTQVFRVLRPTWSAADPGEQGKIKDAMKTRIAELQSQLKGGAK